MKSVEIHFRTTTEFKEQIKKQAKKEKKYIGQLIEDDYKEKYGK